MVKKGKWYVRYYESFDFGGENPMPMGGIPSDYGAGHWLIDGSEVFISDDAITFIQRAEGFKNFWDVRVRGHGDGSIFLKRTECDW